MQNLFKLIRKYTYLDEQTEHALIENLKIEVFKKNDFLLTPGQTCTKLYFVKTGLVRSYYLSDDKEITLWFYKEDDIVGSWHSFYKQKPASEFIQLCEDAELVSISYAVRQKLMDQFASFEKFSRLYGEELLANIDETIKRFSMMSAKEKFDGLMNSSPDLFQRAKLGQIASLLGISQETLSRIRAQK